VVFFCSFIWIEWIQLTCRKIWMFLRINIIIDSLRPLNIFLYLQSSYFCLWH
jgi:uncharacterized protein YhhL (DUF1145 family)